MSRPLTAGEVAIARSVFGEAVDYARVRLSTRRWGGFAIAFGSYVTFPPASPAPADFAAESIRRQAWLIHELVHVWQFQTAPLRTLASWALTVVRGGYGPGLPGYRYRLPLKPWAAHNLEQQASIVEHAFVLRETGLCAGAPAGATAAVLNRIPPFAPSRQT
ncbi:MAG TPA: hypothetical protein VL358_15155 [Caulobacteraceae bacterium]|jgi:hypothetical protein|nr:hypothetical protein [Caulobacteraceae bacterium]